MLIAFGIAAAVGLVFGKPPPRAAPRGWIRSRRCESNNDQHRLCLRMSGLHMSALYASAIVSAALCCTVAVGSAVAAGGSELEQAAESFVGLTLRLGTMPAHEEEIDSYFGPEALRPATQGRQGGLVQLKADADALLSSMEVEQATHPTRRGSRLLARISSFDTLVQVIGPAAHAESFEDEARRLYARSVPTLQAGANQHVIAALGGRPPRPRAALAAAVGVLRWLHRARRPAPRSV